MTLRTANLNLLPILRALLAETSITRAAAAVGLSQPATSHALGRLRALFGDPLLVQVGRTMRPTAKGRELRGRIDAVCASIEDLLLDRVFDPAALVRDFTLATPDYMALVLGPSLMRAIADMAPGVTVRIADVGVDFAAHLAAGEVDVAVIAHVADVTRGFCVRRGYGDRLVGVVSRDHPLARSKRVTEAALGRYRRLGIDPGAMATPDFQGHAAVMNGEGGPLRLSPSHLLALPFLVARTDAVAILPAVLAEEAAAMAPLASFELPFAVAPLDLCMMWSPVHDADPAQGWFRSVLDGAMRERFGGSG